MADRTMISMPGHNHVKGTKENEWIGGRNAATVGNLIEFLKNAIDKGLPLDTPLETGCERHHQRDRADFDRLNPRIESIEWFVHEDIPPGRYGRDWLTVLMVFDRRDEEEPDSEDDDENMGPDYGDGPNDFDDSMDGDHESGLASAGWGTDEDYGG